MQQAAPLVNLVISTGEPAGIGPEISLAAAVDFLLEQDRVAITLLGDDQVLIPSKNVDPKLAHRLQVESIKLATPVISGILNPQNAQYVVNQ